MSMFKMEEEGPFKDLPSIELDDIINDYRAEDPIVNSVIDSYLDRSRLGMVKYGTSMLDNRASFLEWLDHLQQELMDATLYIERVKEELNN